MGVTDGEYLHEGCRLLAMEQGSQACHTDFNAKYSDGSLCTGVRGASELHV